MEKFDASSLRRRYLSNDEINAAYVERLEERLKQINTTVVDFKFKMMIYGDDCLNMSEKAKYEKLINQKEWIENKLNQI